MLYDAGVGGGEGSGAVEQLAASLTEDLAALTARLRAVVARVRTATRAVEELAAAYDASADDEDRRRGP